MHRKDREDTLRRFKSGEIHFLCSVDTITTGFDFPALDCIVCLRPTVSSNLWVQVMGRGTRLHESKQNCLLLDFVGNLQRLGGVDMLETYVREKGGVAGDPILAAPAERKPKRRTLPGVRSMVPLDPMTGEQAKDGANLTVEVHAVSAVPIKTRRDPERPVLMVQYACTTPEGARIDATLFVNTEAPKQADYLFFKNRRLAVNLPALAGTLQWHVRGARIPCYVTARKSGKYWNVTAEHFQQPQE
jgi:DNA repair protein RadD